MRRRFVQINGELVEVTSDYRQEPQGPFVMGDLPAYESPATGKMVEGRAARREDLKRSGCRPWEGLAAEKQNAAQQRAYIEQRLDRHAEESAWRSYYQLSPEKRRILRGA